MLVMTGKLIMSTMGFEPAIVPNSAMATLINPPTNPIEQEDR